MKKLVFLFSLLAFVACNTTPSFKITGTITGNDTLKQPEKAIITNNDRTMPFADTVMIVDGKFEFTGTIDTPSKMYLYFDGFRFNVPFFLDNTKVKMTVDTQNPEKSVVISKNNINHELLTLISDNEKKVGEWLNSLNLMEEYRKPETTPERRAEIEEIYNNAQSKHNAFKDSLLSLHSTSFYALQELYQNAYDLPFNELEERYATFKALPQFAANKHFISTGEKIEALRLIQVGQPALDFTLKSNKGEDITFSTIYPKNKLTMIDFWAGWCGPCRHFNPTLVKIYKEYHKKGFEVVGVSLDRGAELWHQAIKEDKLPWIQVSDLKYWNSEVAKLYCVRYIPQNSFVDANGNIVARQLKENEIEPFLKEFFK